jgi:hypothetical protein
MVSLSGTVPALPRPAGEVSRATPDWPAVRRQSARCPACALLHPVGMPGRVHRARGCPGAPRRTADPQKTPGELASLPFEGGAACTRVPREVNRVAGRTSAPGCPRPAITLTARPASLPSAHSPARPGRACSPGVTFPLCPAASALQNMAGARTGFPGNRPTGETSPRRQPKARRPRTSPCRAGGAAGPESRYQSRPAGREHQVPDPARHQRSASPGTGSSGSKSRRGARAGSRSLPASSLLSREEESRLRRDRVFGSSSLAGTARVMIRPGGPAR